MLFLLKQLGCFVFHQPSLQREVDVLLRGGGHIDLTTARKKPKEWIQDNVWANILALAETDTFR